MNCPVEVQTFSSHDFTECNPDAANNNNDHVGKRRSGAMQIIEMPIANST
jgi:hypothetical protein